MNCPEKAGGLCPDAEACQSGYPCSMVCELAGVTATDWEHDIITAELLRLTLGGKPDRPELMLDIEALQRA